MDGNATLTIVASRKARKAPERDEQHPLGRHPRASVRRHDPPASPGCGCRRRGSLDLLVRDAQRRGRTWLVRGRRGIDARPGPCDGGRAFTVLGLLEEIPHGVHRRLVASSPGPSSRRRTRRGARGPADPIGERSTSGADRDPSRLDHLRGRGTRRHAVDGRSQRAGGGRPGDHGHRELLRHAAAPGLLQQGHAGRRHQRPGCRDEHRDGRAQGRLHRRASGCRCRRRPTRCGSPSRSGARRRSPTPRWTTSSSTSCRSCASSRRRTGFQEGIGGEDDCAVATPANPVCGVVILPQGASSSQVLLSLGPCE